MVATERRMLGQMTEHILEARHELAARDFCQMVQEGMSPLELEREALRTASPFLNVPAHEMVKPDGELRSVNYDHTIMGIWRSLRMRTLMPKGYEHLPAAQAVWYLPQGLDIWSQIHCEFPGHYSREQEKCPTITIRGPKQHFEEYPPLAEGSTEDRLGLLFNSIMQGDKALAFQVFMGLANEAAQNETLRMALESEVLFAGIADFPGPRQYTGMLVNPAHKAIRARAMVDLANAFGWDRAYPAYFVVIPDLANNPRHHDLFMNSHQQLRAAFGADYRELRHTNTGAFSEQEAEEFIRLLHQGTADETMNGVTALLQQGKSLVAINDVAVLATARIMTWIETRNMNFGFFNATHCMDYLNVVGFWLRRYDHAQQMKVAYFIAHHVNDTARYLRAQPVNGDTTFPVRPAEYAGYAEKLSLKQTLTELARVCSSQDSPLATALVDSYLERTKERKNLVSTLVFEAAKIEGDPHLPRLAMTHHEELVHSSLPVPMRDDLFRSWTRYLSHCRRRSDRFDCVKLYDDVLLA